MLKKYSFRSLRILPLLILFVFSPLLLQAGWIEERDGKTIIHVKPWSLPDSTDMAPHVMASRQVIKAFLKRFPKIFAKNYRAKYEANPEKYGKHNWNNVEIQLHKFSGITIEGMAMDSGPLMAIAGGVAPDILYVNFRQSDTYIRNGFLYPLDKPEDDYFSGMTQEEIDYCIYPKIWPVIKRKGPDGKVHIWAKPTGDLLAKVMLYRKDLLEASGVSFPTNNWTWNDFYEACKKITDSEKGNYGFASSKGSDESWNWVTFLWSAGGNVMSYNKDTGEWKAVFASKAGVEALDFYTKLCTEPWRDKDGNLHFGYVAKEDQGRKWGLGQIGFKQSYFEDKLFSNMNPDVTGIVAVPLGPGGNRGGEINSRMQGLFAGIKEPAVRDAAWEFMRFGGSKEARGIRTKIMVGGGLGRFVNPAYLREFGYKDIIRLAPKGWEETFHIAMESGKPEPYGKNCQQVYRYMTVPLIEADHLGRNNELPANKAERNALLMEFLKEAEDLANEKMIGRIPPEKMRIRRSVAWVLLIAIVVSFFLLFRKIFKTFTPPATTGLKKKRWFTKKYLWAYVILSPAILSILLWQYVPLAIGSKMAFQNYQIMQESLWLGVDNFANLLWDQGWWYSVWLSVCYSFMVVSLTFLPPVILAVLLQEVPFGKIFFRTMFYLPAVITGLVVIYLWKSFYEPSRYGVLNNVIMNIPGVGYVLIGTGFFLLLFMFARRLYLQHSYWVAATCMVIGFCLCIFCCGFVFELYHQLQLNAGKEVYVPWYNALIKTPPLPMSWLENPKTALLCCVFPMVWMGRGPGCLIYLAALKGIAPDFYEAADMDGATFIDKILFIVVPTLKPLLIINFVGVFIASWKSTGFILAMAGDYEHTKVAGLHIFFEAYTRLQFGPAAAMAWVLGFMLIWFTVHQLQILSKLEFKTTGNK